MAANKNTFSREALWRAWRRIYRSKTKKKRKTSRGIDGITIEQFKDNEDKYIEELFEEIQKGIFRFQKLYSYKQWKPGKKKPRLIQAPAVRDRIVLSIVNSYLTDKRPADSFRSLGIVGSVKGTSPRKIIREVLSMEQEGFVAVFKTDIQDYFPSVEIARLKKMLNSLLKDEPYIRKMINDFLEINDEEGLAQGSAISPLLANIYLRAFDKRLTKRKTIKHLRYVDDILVFAKSKDTARSTYRPIKVQLWGRGLAIHPLHTGDKTKVGLLRSGKIDVLGVLFTKHGLKIKESKVANFRKNINENLSPRKVLKNKNKSVRKSLSEALEKLNNSIVGWGSAYAICDEDILYSKLDSEIKQKVIALLDSLTAVRNKGGARLHLSYSDRKKILHALPKLVEVKAKIIRRARWFR